MADPHTESDMVQPKRSRKRSEVGRESRRTRPESQTNVQFRRASLHEALLQREWVGIKTSEVVRRDLERYYGFLEAALAQIKLSNEDLRRLAKICRGVEFRTPSEVRLLPHSVAGAVGSNDGLALKLRNLELAELYAVVDAQERYAIRPETTTAARKKRPTRIGLW